MQRLSFLFILFLGTLSFVRSVPAPQQEQLVGAWERKVNGKTEQWLFADGYCSYTVYDKEGQRFGYAMGGPFRMAAGNLEIDTEFHSADSAQVNNKTSIACAVKGNNLIMERSGVQEHWKKIDDGRAPLSGNWHITKRMQGGQLQTIHQTGTRKTVKLLTGSKFQWVAIDPAVKGFYGTGGGSYTFREGKYTEHIEFFSRDSSRVGSTLAFTGTLKDDGWHHNGKSSKGDPIYEVWSRN